MEGWNGRLMNESTENTIGWNTRTEVSRGFHTLEQRFEKKGLFLLLVSLVFYIKRTHSIATRYSILYNSVAVRKLYGYFTDIYAKVHLGISKCVITAVFVTIPRLLI